MYSLVRLVGCRSLSVECCGLSGHLEILMQMPKNNKMRLVEGVCAYWIRSNTHRVIFDYRAVQALPDRRRGFIRRFLLLVGPGTPMPLSKVYL